MSGSEVLGSGVLGVAQGSGTRVPGVGGARAGAGAARAPPDTPQVCGLCPGPSRNDSVVSRYCASQAGAESDGRCCRERGARPERLLGYGTVRGPGGRGRGARVMGCRGCWGPHDEDVEDAWHRGVTGQVLGDMGTSGECRGGGGAGWGTRGMGVHRAEGVSVGDMQDGGARGGGGGCREGMWVEDTWDGGARHTDIPPPLLPPPRLDLSNCSLRSLPPALAEAAATVVL